MNEKEVRSVVCGYLSNVKFIESGGFQKCNSGLHFARSLPEVYQRIVIEITRGLRIRLRVFSTSKLDSQLNLGGNLTRAKVEGADDFGASCSWSLTEDNNPQFKGIGDIELCLENIANPWFSLMGRHESLVKMAGNFTKSTKYKFGKADQLDMDRLPVSNELSSEVIHADESYAKNFILNTLGSLFEDTGFSNIGDADFHFIRERGEVYDVVICKPINYNLHVGIYAFNWTEHLSIDGSGEYSNEFPLMLNGGASNEFGELGLGDRFGFRTCQNLQSHLLHVVNEKILYHLEKVTTKNEFLKTIREDKITIANRFGLHRDGKSGPRKV